MFRPSPIICAIESALGQRLKVISSLAFYPHPPSVFVPIYQDQRHLESFADELLKAGLSPRQAADHIRDAAGRIYLSVLRLPIHLQGVSWFDKAGRFRRELNIPAHRNTRFAPSDPCMAAE